MSEQKPSSTQPSPKNVLQAISLDWWSVIIGLALAALILLGIIPSVPW